MRQHLRFCTFLPLVLLLVVGTALAQTGSVKGRVTDAGTGQGLSGATVALLDQTGGKPKFGAISKKGGDYTITNVTAGSYLLRVTYVGYRNYQEQITVAADRTTTRDIALTLDIINLDEIVVVGAASRTQKSVAEVAVAQINTTELLKANTYQDLNQLLAAKIPGVTLTSSSGNVGGGVRFNVRSGGGLFGNSQPAIYLDGARLYNGEVGFFTAGGQTNSSLFDINPEDIGNIVVLKGAASGALYGTSGSNGVVLLTSRPGTESGRDVSVLYKGTVGYNEQQQEYTADDILSYQDANDVFRKGYFNQHSVMLGGATDLFKYSTSFSTRLDNGILSSSRGERRTVRANFDVIPSDKVSIRVSGLYGSSSVNRPPGDNYILGYLGNTLLFGPGVDSTGNPVSQSYAFATRGAIDSMINESITDRFIGSAEINYQPIEALNLRGVIGYDGIAGTDNEIFPAGSNYSAIGVSRGQRGLYNRSISQYNVDLSADYAYALSDDLATRSIIGTQLFSSKLEENYIQKMGFSTDLVNNIAAGEQFVAGDNDIAEVREAGIFFQQEFDYDNTYYFSVGVRNDYASSFGDEAPSIFYPRASAAVLLNKLDLLPASFNQAKFRLAYGQSGQLPDATDGDPRRWAAGESGFGAGAVITSIGNAQIEPERIQEFEAGLELQLDSAYGIDFTYYRTFARNSIIGFLNAPSTGLTATSVPTNIGSIDGWGFEANVYATPWRSDDYEVQLNLIWNYSDNEVKDLGGAQPIQSNANVIKEGLPRSSFYLPTVIGATFDSAGVYSGVAYKLDSNGLPLYEYHGTPVPKHTGSFSVGFRFLKNFRLSGLADWGLGNSIFNQTKQFANDPGLGINTQENRTLVIQLGLAPPDAFGPSNIQPLTPGTAEYIAAAQRYAKLDVQDLSRANWIEEADYLRIREISLGYDLSSLLESLPQSAIRYLEVVVSARNVALFTGYSGKDVEVNQSGPRGIERGSDFLTLQSPRTYNLTIQLGF